MPWAVVCRVSWEGNGQKIKTLFAMLLGAVEETLRRLTFELNSFTKRTRNFRVTLCDIFLQFCWQC